MKTKHSTDYGLIYPTFHLKNFDLVKASTGLYGDDYILIIKSEWYGLHGQVIKKEPVRLGDVKTDGRMCFACCLPSGYGKKHIEAVFDKTCEGLGEKVSKPTSYHPEQLVGKTLRIEKKGSVTYEKIEGHFADDLVIFDDAIDLIRGEEILYRESRKYLCTALDPIGENLLTKRMVGIPREHALKYYPHCAIILFFQPFSLPEEVFLCGLFRRFILIYLEFQGRDLREDFSHKVDGDCYGDHPISSLTDYLLRLKKNNLILPSIKDDEVKEKFKELHFYLVEFGKAFGSKSANFTNMIAFGLQNWLLKMATILAYSQEKNEVGMFDVEMAFVDLLEFLHSTLNFVEKKVMGLLDYGESWKGATGNDLELLKWLHDEGALSEEKSKVSINAYLEKISDVLNIKEDGARKRYQRHKRMGWINGKQIGSHDSVVYLNFKPLFKDEGGKGGRVIKEYREILRKYSLIPNSGVSPLSPSTSQVSSLSPNCNFSGLDKDLDEEDQEAISPSTIVENGKDRGITLSPLSPIEKQAEDEGNEGNEGYEGYEGYEGKNIREKEEEEDGLREELPKDETINPYGGEI